MYTSKRRQRNFKRVRTVVQHTIAKSAASHQQNQQQHAGQHQASSNPSKRHRERLNGELETVASLLPYNEHIIQRLDKLSVLRLAVAFLQIKAHFKTVQKCLPKSGRQQSGPFGGQSQGFIVPFESGIPTIVDPITRMAYIDPAESSLVVLAQRSLNAFIMILKEDGDIFYVSENIETFLGYQQSDVLHQSLLEMIHSEDRDSIRAALRLASSADNNSTLLVPGSDPFGCTNSLVNLVCRFRCLLDNTCGFVRVEIRGKAMPVYSAPLESSFLGPSHQPVEQIALVAICTPFVPPVQMYSTADDPILKSKHSLDLTILNMDRRLRLIFDTSDSSASSMDKSSSLYSLVHPEDTRFLAEVHDTVLKFCSAGILVYRLLNQKTGAIYYAQSSFRLFFKNGKPDNIGATHRLLNEVDGESLLEKRHTVKLHYASFEDGILDTSNSIFPVTSQSNAPADGKLKCTGPIPHRKPGPKKKAAAATKNSTVSDSHPTKSASSSTKNRLIKSSGISNGSLQAIGVKTFQPTPDPAATHQLQSLFQQQQQPLSIAFCPPSHTEPIDTLQNGLLNSSTTTFPFSPQSQVSAFIEQQNLQVQSGFPFTFPLQNNPYSQIEHDSLLAPHSTIPQLQMKPDYHQQADSIDLIPYYGHPEFHGGDSNNPGGLFSPLQLGGSNLAQKIIFPYLYGLAPSSGIPPAPMNETESGDWATPKVHQEPSIHYAQDQFWDYFNARSQSEPWPCLTSTGVPTKSHSDGLPWFYPNSIRAAINKATPADSQPKTAMAESNFTDIDRQNRQLLQNGLYLANESLSLLSAKLGSAAGGGYNGQETMREFLSGSQHPYGFESPVSLALHQLT